MEGEILSIFKDQAEFLTAGEKQYPTADSNELDLSACLVEEEYNEWVDEEDYACCGNCNDIKEILDLIYVSAQYLNVRIGPEKAQELWDRLHENNMSKCINGKLVKRSDGKILKPEGYEKFNIGNYLL